MTQVFIPSETHPDETRVAVIPAGVSKLIKLGVSVSVQSGLGKALYPDSAYTEAGATLVPDPQTGINAATVVIRIRPPQPDEIATYPKGLIHISSLDPFQSDDLINAFNAQSVTAVSTEMLPRTTIAQKMDILSSQASLAGYVAVVLGADSLDQVFPMMMTPSGTLSPAKVFVIGAGVAGLQAIATAKRLGARVSAFDTRPVVEEQVQSLGAKFVKVDLGDMGQTKDGYAKALTPEQLEKQREVMAKECENSDLVITTAQVFGRKAPVIITSDMVARMSAGSVIVDLAVGSGGNVEGSQVNQTVDINGVKIIGRENYPGHVAKHASEMLSMNYFYMMEHLVDTESKSVSLDFEDEITGRFVMTHDGQLVNEMVKSHREKKDG